MANWLSEAKKRCDEATPGPWRLASGYWTLLLNGDEARSNDMEFIAHARTDLPKALELLERVRRVLVDIPDDDVSYEINYEINKWIEDLEK